MKKTIVLLIMCLCTGVLSACGSSTDSLNTGKTSPDSTEITQESGDGSSSEKQILYFETDDLVNDFFEKYNSVSEDPIDSTKIKKGNIDTKALVYIDDFGMEVINSNRGYLSVSVSTSPQNEETYLHNVFKNCIKCMNQNLNDEQIKNAWEDIHANGYMVNDYDLDGITIDYIPYKELSQGHSDLRIDLTFPIE